jgi:hypothetical protein
VADLPKLLKSRGGNVGWVNGFKLERRDPWHRIWIGEIYNRSRPRPISHFHSRM